MNNKLTKQRALTILGLVALVAALMAAGLRSDDGRGPVRGGAEEEKPATKRYANATYGVEFDYPAEYTLAEKESYARGATGTVAVLSREPMPSADVPGEAPPTIEVAMYRMPEPVTASEWITRHDELWAMSRDKATSPARANGIEGLGFEWSGLYEGTRIVATKGNIVATLTASFLTREDATLRDFQSVVRPSFDLK